VRFVGELIAFVRVIASFML